jgi:curved DNA-binding protein CbpA
VSLNYYELLNIDSDATFDQIQKAFRKLSKVYHPDQSGSISNDRAFREITEARDCLVDPDRRKEYDRALLGDSISGQHEYKTSETGSPAEPSSNQKTSSSDRRSQTSASPFQQATPIRKSIKRRFVVGSLSLYALGWTIRIIGSYPHFHYVEQFHGDIESLGLDLTILFLIIPRNWFHNALGIFGRNRIKQRNDRQGC